MIDLQEFRTKLAHNGTVIEHLVRSVGETQARWRPAENKWNVLDVVCHLLDEEREDFRNRIDMTLHHPGEPWPRIDPEGWVTSRNYAARDLSETLDQLLEERVASVAWLGTLADPAWDAVYRHPLGDLTAGDLMAAWLAHDYLHIRQLTKLLFDYTMHITTPYATGYAGEW